MNMYEADGAAGHMTMAMQCRAIKMKIVDAVPAPESTKGAANYDIRAG